MMWVENRAAAAIAPRPWNVNKPPLKGCSQRAILQPNVLGMVKLGPILIIKVCGVGLVPSSFFSAITQVSCCHRPTPSAFIARKRS